MLRTIVLVLLILALVGALPNWGHSLNWGYGPSGGLGIILIIVIVLALTGRFQPNRFFQAGIKSFSVSLAA